jgi:cbb3-type cytochrome oxidase subunit 1
MTQGPTAAGVMQLSLKYVKASLTYLAVGGTLLLLTFAHLMPFDMTAFYFMQLYGFVAMMIFGLSYLFVPSFAHAFLHSLRLAKLQFWLMNIGVIGMTIAFSGLLPYNPNIRFLVVGSLVMLVLALYMHVYNLWRTMRGWKGSPGEKLARDAQAASPKA